MLFRTLKKLFSLRPSGVETSKATDVPSGGVEPAGDDDHHLTSSIRPTPALPNELWLEIFGHCAYFDLKRIEHVSRRFQYLARHRALAGRSFGETLDVEQFLAAWAREDVTLHPLFRLIEYVGQDSVCLLHGLHCKACLPSTIVKLPVVKLAGRKAPLSMLHLSAAREQATSPPVPSLFVTPEPRCFVGQRLRLATHSDPAEGGVYVAEVLFLYLALGLALIPADQRGRSVRFYWRDMSDFLNLNENWLTGVGLELTLLIDRRRGWFRRGRR